MTRLSCSTAPPPTSYTPSQARTLETFTQITEAAEYDALELLNGVSDADLDLLVDALLDDAVR